MTAIRIVATANFNAGTKLTDILGYANIQTQDRGAYEVNTYAYFNNYIQHDSGITIAGTTYPTTVTINSQARVDLIINGMFKFVNYVSVVFPANFVPTPLCYPDSTTAITITSMSYDSGNRRLLIGFA